MDPALKRHRDAVRASVERLRTIDETAPLDAAGVAGAVASELHGLLGGSLSVAYRPARAANDWIIGAVGPRSEVISTSLARTVTASADWFRYDPLRPAVEQRNTVSATERTGAPAAAGPFFDRLGKNIGQTRLLLCDGPVLLAWVGILREPERRHDVDRDVLRRIGLAARRHLRLALGVPGSFKFSSFEVSLDAYPGEAYVVRRDGRVEFANALGAERLAGSGKAVLKELREAVASYPVASEGFELHPLRASSLKSCSPRAHRTKSPRQDDRHLSLCAPRPQHGCHQRLNQASLISVAVQHGQARGLRASSARIYERHHHKGSGTT